MKENSATTVDYDPTDEDLKNYSDFCKKTFSSERGLWILPSSLSVFVVDLLEGIFELVAGNKNERSTGESIRIIEKLGYDVKTENSLINSDDSDLDLTKEVGVHGILEWVGAEEITIGGFISCKDLRIDSILSYHKIMKTLNTDNKNEIERCKRFSLVLKIMNKYLEKEYIKSIIMTGKK